MAAAANAFQAAGFTASNQPVQQDPPTQQEEQQQVEKPVFSFEQKEPQQQQSEFIFTQQDKPVNEVAGDQAVDYSYLKNIAGGRFSNPDELEQYIRGLEGRQSPEEIFANDYIRDLNDAVRAGIDPELFATVSSINLDELTPKDALILQYQMRDGLSWEDAEMLVNETYRLDDEMYSDDDAQTKTARIKAKVDANQAYEYLSQYKSDALTPPIEKQIERQVEAWAPVIPKVIESFKTLEFEGKAGKYQFPVSEENQREAAKLFNDVLQMGIVDAMPNEDGMEFAKNLVYKELVMREAVNMLDTLVEKLKLQQISSKHNLSGSQMFGGSPPPDDKNSLYEFLAAAKGMKYNNY